MSRRESGTRAGQMDREWQRETKEKCNCFQISGGGAKSDTAVEAECNVDANTSPQKHITDSLKIEDLSSLVLISVLSR